MRQDASVVILVREMAQVGLIFFLRIVLKIRDILRSACPPGLGG